MGIVSGIVTFLVIWWVVLFLVLPVGVTVSRFSKLRGLASSAPQKFSFKRTFWYTTAVSTVIFILFFLFQAELNDFVFAQDSFFAIDANLD